ncbi:hypothetical protein [Oerskovia merdavium]|uniref:hypothetical protein n=1 Tax=Oerskovia merdavium TaxID=2762227 RepID=UPI001CD85CA5|nr:hypothetical protein [Oerskovia merdavium]
MILIALGAFMMVFVPDIVAAMSEWWGLNAAAGVVVVNYVLTAARWTMYPTAASLIGAAVIIETFKESLGRSSETNPTAKRMSEQ